MVPTQNERASVTKWKSLKHLLAYILHGSITIRSKLFNFISFHFHSARKTLTEIFSRSPALRSVARWHSRQSIVRNLFLMSHLYGGRTQQKLSALPKLVFYNEIAYYYSPKWASAPTMTRQSGQNRISVDVKFRDLRWMIASVHFEFDFFFCL